MIRLVFLKELIDHLRDRRSVIGSLVLPVVGPLLLLAMVELISDLKSDTTLDVPVVGAEHAPDLVKYLVQNGAHILPAPVDPESVVRRGEADMVLLVDPAYPERFAAGKSAPVRLIVDDSRNDSQKNVRRLSHLLAAYSQKLAALRLIARGVSPEVAAPVQLEEIDLATPEKLAANLLNVVPLFLMFAALAGGMNVAIDTTAGERERGSLEPLLLNPVPRGVLVLGKWLATVTASAAVTLMTLIGFLVTLQFLPLEELGMKVLLGPKQALMMLAAVLPLALFGSALQMLIATFARTFKEAQTYLNLLNLVPMAPSMFLMFKPAQSEWWMLPLPTVAQIGTVVDVMRGEVVPAWHLPVIAASSLGYATICLVCLVRLLGQERIIYGRT
jgi:sodium transport system permease protein